MEEVTAYSTFVMTLGLIVGRPRIGRGFRIGPASAAALGVLLMMLGGVVHWANLEAAVAVMWRPVFGIVSIMVMTAVAGRVGVLEKLTFLLFAPPRRGDGRGSAERLFTRVFALSALTAAILNNDSAVLLLTPIIVTLVRRRYPRHPALVVPFALVVFMSAGVAPLVVSNPMNMVVASYAGIGFNAYAQRMIPIAVFGWILAYLVLRALAARTMRRVGRGEQGLESPAMPWTPAQTQILVLLAFVLAAYPTVSYFGGPIWLVAAAGAALALALAARAEHSVRSVANDISWNILVFLILVFVLATGLKNVGLVGHIEAAYARGGILTIGVCSALGSAILNNHPMSTLNMLALEGSHPFRQEHVLAALIGGDLGPRLFPSGSLAGLLWFESLRRLDVDISIGRFVLVGALVTLPSLAASLLLLNVM